ncbi:MAG TPA: GTP-binding protein, partial [Gemmatales bacterium]|nr:GTP-binding protein [Gemmatales bacterium]
MTPPKLIRNFCIIAHIDHGKSTLADQFLLKCNAISERDFRNQVLDAMDLEQERGITIQMHPVTIFYDHGGTRYELNLIDTPGHVDFNYEVSRSLAACEGAILLVDAFQGVQAQTVHNALLALEAGLTIIPVVNKIDLPYARTDEVISEMEHSLGIFGEEVLKVSAKAGLGIEELFQAIVERIPDPSSRVSAEADQAPPLKALVYNSHFDSYKGVVVYIRVMEGEIKPGMKIRLMAGAQEYTVQEIGQFRPKPTTVPSLQCGQVGYFTANIKNLRDVRIGDTVTDSLRPTAHVLPGYKAPKPMVFSGLYPVDTSEF